jgi:hypothetical protein
MHAAAVIVVTALALAACGAEADKAASTPEVVAAPEVPAVGAGSAATVVLNGTSRQQVCVAGMAAIHGQTIDAAGVEGETVGAVRVDGTDGNIISLSWPAPVDGGRRYADCRIEGDVIQWRPTRPGSGEVAAWMNGPADPVTRFAFEGDEILVTQTFDDGTRTQTTLSAPSARGQG